MVIRAEALKLTILLPIRIADSILWVSSQILRTRPALLFPSSDRAFILTLLAVIRAVSADEKKADKRTSSTNTVSLIE
jgi:hypothetical protein